MYELQLFHLSQSVVQYNAYDSCVVAAYNKKVAANIRPNGYKLDDLDSNRDKDWCDNAEEVNVMYIGTAAKHIIPNSVICRSFNAG